MARKGTIEGMRVLAASRGGWCLSKIYCGSGSKLIWKCRLGHEWLAVPESIAQGRWCPNCSSSLRERICRNFLETFFHAPFPKVRPLWLKNWKGNRMELDGYLEERNIAFEHHGQQHYKFSRMLSLNRNLEEQKRADKLKRKICKERKIILLEIAYKVPKEDLGEHIVNLCKKKGIYLNISKEKLSLNLAKINSFSNLKKMQDKAISRGGKCLSQKYVDSQSKLKWMCKSGHTWIAVPSSINAGTWCLICSGSKKKTMKEMQDFAKGKGGKCISKKYINMRSKLRWQCSKLHTWEAKPNHIFSKHWCPVCANVKKGSFRKLNLEEMVELARKKGGLCLSKTYKGVGKKLVWQCNSGHKWKAVPGQIKYQNQWCPDCYNLRRLSSQKLITNSKARRGIRTPE